MKGNITVELSLIFPVILIVLIMFMQFGLYFVYRIYTLNAVNQSLAICSRARQEKKSVEEATRLAEKYLNDVLIQFPIEITELQCETVTGWFEEEYIMVVSAKYSFMFELSWIVVEKSCAMNPVEFRNRFDFIWEKGKQYLDQLKGEVWESGGEK